LRLANSLLYAAAGSHVETVLGVVTSIVIARSLGAEHYGLYALLLIWATLAQALVNSGVTLGAQRFVAQARARGQYGIAGKIARRLRSIQWAKTALGLLVVGIGLPIYGRAGESSVTLPVIVLVLASIAFRSQYTFNVSVCKGAGDFRGAAIVAWVGGGTNLVLVCVAAVILPSVNGFLIAYALSTAAFLATSWWRSRSYLQDPGVVSIPPELQADVSRHLRVVTLSTALAQLASSQIEIFMLGLWAPAADVGYFRLGNMLAGGAVGVVSGVVASVVLPYLSKAIAQGDAHAARAYLKLTRYLVLLAVPVVVVAAVLARTLVVTVYGTEFAMAAGAFAVIIAALALADVNTPAQAYLLGSGRQYTVLSFTVLALVLKLTVGAYLIHRFGLEGAIASLAGTIVLISIVKSWLVRRQIGVGFPLAITLRVLLFAGASSIPAIVFSVFLPGAVTLVLGAACFAPLYCTAVLRGRCLTPAELALAEGVLERLPPPVRKAGSTLLRHARPLAAPPAWE
jgi:O-antigen/teichoic acid export membrane protein